MANPNRAPFPKDKDDFNADNRISFSKEAGTHILEDETGEEWEWHARISKWVPTVRNAEPRPPNPRRASACVTPILRCRATAEP